MRKPSLTHALVFVSFLVVAALAGCTDAPDTEDLAHARTPLVRAVFNEPGTRLETGTNSIADDALDQLIDNARHTIDFAVMGFYRPSVVDALVRAWKRGVEVRMVGDARHMEGGTDGYIQLERLNIPMIVGNMYHIMHNKFFIVDGRWVVSGTGNITSTGFERNDNNWAIIDSPQVASDFQAEFDQMFNGRFGAAKQFNDNGNTYQVGDTRVEVYFSPQEDAMGRIIEAVRDAKESVQFYIFAFTKDELGAEIIRKHGQFERYNRCCIPEEYAELDDNVAAECEASPAVTCTPTVSCRGLEIPIETAPGWTADDVPDALAAEGIAAAACGDYSVSTKRKSVRGVIDRSQLHGNGPYHEAYRMLAYGVNLVMDGNRNSYNPGDYQAGGGRQHAKTMIIDPDREDGLVLSGSFNWSSSATVSNDETLLTFQGRRIQEQFDRQFEGMWRRGQDPSKMFVSDQVVNPGDIIINEVHWDGWNGDYDSSTPDDPVYNDEFVELLNTTDRPINMSLFQLTDESDFIVGFFPGTVIGPYERFLVLDHNIVPYDDTVPQEGKQAFDNPDFVMNTANDVRFLRLNLRNANFRLELRDANGRILDVAGDGGPPFWGGRRETGAGEGCRTRKVRCQENAAGDACVDFPDNGFNTFVPDFMRNFSMERKHRPECATDPSCSVIGPGDRVDSWERAAAPGLNVRPRFQECIYATPGEPNSGGTAFPEEDPNFRTPPGAGE